MSQTTEQRIAAIESLLPLLEAHTCHHGRTTTRAQWQSTYEPPEPGYVPPPPEPTCEGRCQLCGDFRTRRCTLREERWAAEWVSLRDRYPVLHTLEMLLWMLGQERPIWASAIYWQCLQPWERWNPDNRETWARLGVEWIEERLPGWIPRHVERVVVKQASPREAKRQWVAEMIQQGFTSLHICREVRCSEQLVANVRKTLTTGKAVDDGHVGAADRR